MTFSIYGVSRSGKDYLIQKLIEHFAGKGLSLLHINGSATLNDMANRLYSKRFKQLAAGEQDILRANFIRYVHHLEKDHPYIVVDGHYAFYDANGNLFSVFTQYDLKCYDQFFYLDSSPEIIVERMRSSEGEKKNDTMSVDDVRRWQDYEVEAMTQELIQDDKELHIIKYETDFCLEYIFDAVTSDKYNSKAIAAKMLEDITLTHSTVILTDCDKTLSVEDSTDIALEYIGASKAPLKKIFSGDRYSNFQMMLAHSYYCSVNAYTEEVLRIIRERITLNQAIIADLRNKANADVLAITAGNSHAWQTILDDCGLTATVLANTGLTSKYVKYYTAKLLREKGKYVIAIGDSLLDSMMLKQANIGYLATKGYRENIARFVRKNPSIRQLSYFSYKYDDLITDDAILSIKTIPYTQEVPMLIDTCKSGSGIAGAELRAAHEKLGGLVAQQIVQDHPQERFAVVVMMRSGFCFGLGIANALDIPVLFYDDKNPMSFTEQINDNPQLIGCRFILCDGVVNTGRSILDLADACSDFDPILATNVISDQFDTSNMLPIYAGRISKNRYTGSKQKNIFNGKGPDTSDRLFKLL